MSIFALIFHHMRNKLKIINDPVHGFIKIPHEILFDIIEHPYFQRLRRISQTGLLSSIFPGATHTRFHHAIGAMHLMYTALETLKLKGITISREEEKSAMLAILLHDIGHGPFSHALENMLMDSWHHEKLSLLLLKELNEEYSGELSMAIEMFQGRYHRKFFNQLISSQLDVDRLDYLKELFKFNDKDIENIKKEFTIPSTYNLQLLFYEVPLQYMRGRIGKKTKSVYTPLADENSKFVKEYINKLLKEFKILVSPIKVYAEMYLPIPKYFKKKEIVAAELGLIKPITKPDADNLIKGYLDAFNDNIYIDDSLIYSLNVTKYYSIKPRVVINLEYDSDYNSDTQINKIIKSKNFIDSFPEDLYMEVSQTLKEGKYYKGGSSNE